LARGGINSYRRNFSGNERRCASAEAIQASRPGGITNWLVLLPISFEGLDGARALKSEQLPGESGLRPRAGDVVRAGPRDLVWGEINLRSSTIDFKEPTGADALKEYQVAYAVCYLQSDPTQSAVLKVASDDQARVYINSQLVYDLPAREPIQRTKTPFSTCSWKRA
jgi:hypothetical protein